MLYIVTAPPRTGKSQYVVKLGTDWKAQGKRVFVTNFNQTDEQRQASGFEDFDTPNEWWEKLPNGAVWIIDECQEIWPQRSGKVELPQYIKQLSLHGHHDLTIYVVTQDAMQVDVHIRRNCNFMYYLTRPLNMRAAKVYLFRGYQQIPNDAWRRSQVLKQAESKTKFRYSKRYQGLYVSASSHEHIKMRFPLRLLVLPVAALVTGWCLWFAVSRLMANSSDESLPGGVQMVAGTLLGSAGVTVPGQKADSLSAVESASDVPITAQGWAANFEPRVEGVPASAPAYDGFEVKDYPRALCVISGEASDSECRCYTQQATRLRLAKDPRQNNQLCRQYALHGYFDPLRAPLDSAGDSDAGEKETGAEAGSGGPVMASIPPAGLVAAPGGIPPQGEPHQTSF